MKETTASDKIPPFRNDRGKRTKYYIQLRGRHRRRVLVFISVYESLTTIHIEVLQHIADLHLCTDGRTGPSRCLL